MKNHEGNIPGRPFSMLAAYTDVKFLRYLDTAVQTYTPHHSNSIRRHYGFMLVRPLTETEKQCSTLLVFIYGPRLHLAVFSGKKQVALASILRSIPKFYLLDRDLPLNHPALQN